MESRKPSRRSSMIEMVEKHRREQHRQHQRAGEIPAQVARAVPDQQPEDQRRSHHPQTRLFCRQKRTSSRCQRVEAGSQKDGFPTGADAQRLFGGYGSAQSINAPVSCTKTSSRVGLCSATESISARESLHHFGDKAVAVGDLHAQHPIHHGRRHARSAPPCAAPAPSGHRLRAAPRRPRYGTAIPPACPPPRAGPRAAAPAGRSGRLRRGYGSSVIW